MVSFIKEGFFTTLQDQGRFGYRNKGVPVSGVMDAISATNANAMLDNDSNSAVLEITMTGPTLEFSAPTAICMAGASMSPELNGEKISNLEVYQIKNGDVLSFGKLEKGFRTYLAIKDGFTSALVLKSRSFFYPLTEKKCFGQYNQLEYAPYPEFKPKLFEAKMENFLDDNILQVTKGPEYDILSKQEKEKLFSNTFTIAKENNRMAYQLNEYLSEHRENMLTSATLPGTVQLTPSGRIIILMRDGQTTGGYPRILNLTPRSICILAQKKTRDRISFRLI